MLDDVDDPDMRLTLIETAQHLYDYQAKPEFAGTVEAIRTTVYDTAVAVRDGEGLVNDQLLSRMEASLGRAAVLTWSLACSSLVGPLRPQTLATLEQCVGQFAFPVQLPGFRESRLNIARRRAWRLKVEHALAHAVHWHGAWSENGPVAAIAEMLYDSFTNGGEDDECRKALGFGLHLLASWRLRVIEL